MCGCSLPRLQQSFQLCFPQYLPGESVSPRLGQVYSSQSKNWLDIQAQKLVVNRAESSQQLVTSGITQGSELGPALFIVFINDLDECTLSRFADNIKLGGSNLPEGRKALQKDLDRLDQWAEANCMSLTRVLSPTLQFQQLHASMHQYGFGAEWLESCTKDLGVAADSQMNVSQQCSQVNKKGSGTLTHSRNS